MREQLRKNLWFAYLTALVTWMILSYGWFAGECKGGKLFAFLENGRPFVSDFVNSYNAATLAKHCEVERVAIYDPNVQAQSQAKLTAPVRAELPFYLQYPPYFFVLMRPLAEFSMLQAWFLWCTISTLLLLYVLKFLIFPVLA